MKMRKDDIHPTPAKRKPSCWYNSPSILTPTGNKLAKRPIAGQTGRHLFAGPCRCDLNRNFELVDLKVQRCEPVCRPRGEEVTRNLPGPLHTLMAGTTPAEGRRSIRAHAEKCLDNLGLPIVGHAILERGQRLRHQTYVLLWKLDEHSARDRCKEQGSHQAHSSANANEIHPEHATL